MSTQLTYQICFFRISIVHYIMTVRQGYSALEGVPGLPVIQYTLLFADIFKLCKYVPCIRAIFPPRHRFLGQIPEISNYVIHTHFLYRYLLTDDTNIATCLRSRGRQRNILRFRKVERKFSTSKTPP